MQPLVWRDLQAGQGGPDPLPLPAGLLPEAQTRVQQSRRFDRDLHVTRLAREAVAALQQEHTLLVPGARLGLILASQHGDQQALSRRMHEFREQIGKPEVAPTDLFRAIAYFPVGRVLRSVAEKLGARGPLAPVPDLATAHKLADIWLASGRADQVVVVQADSHGPHEATAFAECLQGTPRPLREVSVQLVSHAGVTQQTEGLSCARLTRDVLLQLQWDRHQGRTALVVGSLLGNAGESLYATVAPREPGPDLPTALQTLALEQGFTEVFVLVGSSGGTLTGLALAHDLLRLDRADRVVVCGADLLQGAMAGALGLLQCHDLPHMVGGAIAVVLEAAPQTDWPVLPLLHSCTLHSPHIPAMETQPLDLTSLETAFADIGEVHLSGLNSVDLAASRQVAQHLFPGVVLGSTGETRSVGADVLRLLVEGANTPGKKAIVGMHSLGGAGVVVIEGT